MAKPHLIIDAGPGSGKTTTMVAGLNIMQGQEPTWFEFATDEQKAIWESLQGNYRKIGFMAFNKSIATELQEKVPHNVEARTFHSFGFAALRSAGYKFKSSGDNVKYMVKDMMGYDKKDRMTREHLDLLNKIVKIVGLLKNNLLECTKQNVLILAEHNCIEINGELADIVDYGNKVLMKCKRIQPGEFTWIDFDDMIWLPIVLDLDFSDIQFDLLICDESQDLNPVQHELVQRACRRLICVGDPRQAIYGFRGADSKSMTTLQELLGNTDRGVQVLPLQTSFRLPKSGVENVKSFAPDLVARTDAVDGEILEQYVDEVKPTGGDLVVSRINANIFTMAFQMLRKKIPVRIQGREYGDTLKKLICQECELSDSIDAARANLQDYNQRELKRLEKKTFAEKLIDAHNEKMSCLYFLSEGCNTVGQMVDVIDQLFGNNLPRAQVVLFSTVHKAKGLEADRVYFLEPGLVPHPMAKQEHEKAQEYNIKFVAETRHKQTLVYVHPRLDDDQRDELEDRLLDDSLESNEVLIQ